MLVWQYGNERDCFTYNGDEMEDPLSKDPKPVVFPT